MRKAILVLLLPCLLTLYGCGGGRISGDGMDTGSFLTAEISIPFDIDACENLNVFADITFDNQDLPVPGAVEDEANETVIIIHTSRHVTIDRYSIEYIPIDSVSPPLSLREYFQTLQLPPNSSIEFTDINFIDVNTKQEFLNFISNNPGITNGTYSVVYHFHGHNDLGAEISAAATGSFFIFGDCS